MPLTTRPLVIYHSPCADGFSAAWCFWKRYASNAQYVEGRYSEAPLDVTDRDVYLVDFSYKRDVVIEMVKVARSVTLIDHHKSALLDLQDIDGLNYFCDLNHSGAMLAWKFLFGDNKAPTLLHYVEDRDLWRFRLIGSREVSAALFSYEYEFSTWDILMDESLTSIESLTSAGKSISRKHDKDIRELIKFGKRFLEIGGHTVPVVNLPYTMSSEAGHILAQEAPFAASYMDGENYRFFSLRSKEGGLDVSAIATSYGGGGHPHAAGFRVARDHILACN